MFDVKPIEMFDPGRFQEPALYSVIIWEPGHTINGSIQCERAQRKFLRHASFILGIQCLPRDYSSHKNSWPRRFSLP